MSVEVRSSQKGGKGQIWRKEKKANAIIFLCSDVLVASQHFPLLFFTKRVRAKIAGPNVRPPSHQHKRECENPDNSIFHFYSFLGSI